jgi:hypothetical protein
MASKSAIVFEEDFAALPDFVDFVDFCFSHSHPERDLMWCSSVVVNLFGLFFSMCVSVVVFRDLSFTDFRFTSVEHFRSNDPVVRRSRETDLRDGDFVRTA